MQNCPNPQMYLRDPVMTNGQSWDSRHLDRFLKNNQWTNIKLKSKSKNIINPSGSSELFCVVTNQQIQKFKTQSSVLPCDFNDFNHFGREGRYDLAPSQQLFVVEGSKPKQRPYSSVRNPYNAPASANNKQASSASYHTQRDIVQTHNNYTTEKSRNQTKTYFNNLVQKRLSEEEKNQEKALIKRASALKNRYRSGVLGYEPFSKDLVPSNSPSKIPKKTLMKTCARKWVTSDEVKQIGSNTLTPQSTNNQATLQTNNYVFNNILAPKEGTKPRKQRTENIMRNEVRRNYNFLTLQQYK